MIRLLILRCALLTSVLAMSSCGFPDRPLSSASLQVAEGTAATLSRFQITHAITTPHWDRIERLTSSYERFPAEQSRPNGRHTDPDIVRAFGSATPPSRDVLLHCAPGWDSGSGIPVVLVHGAILEATSNWSSPHGKVGLAPTLADQGHRVFAVTFAHRHGDNQLWAEQLANVIARVRELTGSPKVDVVAHSKGTVAARALASGLRKPWMSPYRKDIRRLVLVAGPHLGIDYTYRHAVVNLGLYPEKDDPRMNAPMSWSRMLVMGRWVDTSTLTMLGDFFPGQAQLLARWDQVYPLPMLEQDWYTTYHGGQGFVSYSSGIEKAIAKGGHFIERLRKHPLDRSIELAVLAGNRANLSTVYNETTGPSDGVVFLKSASATTDMTRGGARLIAEEVLPLNHMELVYAPSAKSWIAKVLSQ